MFKELWLNSRTVPQPYSRKTNKDLEIRADMFAEIRQTGIGFDLKEIDSIQEEFDAVLGPQKEQGKIRSYDLVLSRWNFERKKQKLETFKEYEEWQLKTFLEERYGIPKEPVNFITDEKGDVYSELLPSEAFNTVLERGIEYRKNEGSVEEKREWAELDGWIKIQKKLLDPKTRLCSQMIVVSGSGIVKGTSYANNYVDLYESYMDFKSQKRGIVRRRFVSDLSYEEYGIKILENDPNYFDNFSGPVDAWFLANPIFADVKDPKLLFEEILTKNKSEITAEQFEEIFIACMPFITNYINILCSDVLDPENIALAFNAVINKADLEKRRKLTNDSLKPGVIFTNTADEIAWLGIQQVVEVLVGCGMSGGYKINSKINNLLANSVGKYGVEDDDPLEFKCQNGHWNKREPGKYLKNCRVCGCDVSCGIASAE